MLRQVAMLAVTLTLASCSSPDPGPCSYGLWSGMWVGSVSYTATIIGRADGAAGASALSVRGVSDCHLPVASVELGGCTIGGGLGNARALVVDPASTTCRVSLAHETLDVRVRQGSAQLAANDAMALRVGGDLVARGGEPVSDATFTLEFEGRRE